MRSTRPFLILAAGALAASLAGASNAYAVNDLHESYIDQLQKNPSLIEPGNESRRYRIGDPRDGYDDRLAARDGYYTRESGYDPRRPRGRVVVEPYRYR